MPNYRIGDKVIEFSSSVKYLGLCINDTITDSEDIKLPMKVLFGTANWLKKNFTECSNRLIKFLFKKYCTMFYVCQLWSTYSYSSTELLKVMNCMRQ